MTSTRAEEERARSRRCQVRAAARRTESAIIHSFVVPAARVWADWAGVKRELEKAALSSPRRGHEQDRSAARWTANQGRRAFERRCPDVGWAGRAAPACSRLPCSAPFAGQGPRASERMHGRLASSRYHCPVHACMIHACIIARVSNGPRGRANMHRGNSIDSRPQLLYATAISARVSQKKESNGTRASKSLKPARQARAVRGATRADVRRVATSIRRLRRSRVGRAPWTIEPVRESANRSWWPSFRASATACAPMGCTAMSIETVMTDGRLGTRVVVLLAGVCVGERNHCLRRRTGTSELCAVTSAAMATRTIAGPIQPTHAPNHTRGRGGGTGIDQ
jgi:hypothetical protein